MEVHLSGLQHPQQGPKLRPRSHIPSSIFFEKIIPILLIVMGVVTALLILFAAGVLLGVVKF